MKSCLLGVTGATLLAAFAHSLPAALLDDPGFEAATDGTQISNSGWTLTSNFPDGTNPAATFEDPLGVGSSIGVWFRSFEGQQDVGDAAADAELMQMVNAMPGLYSLTFWVNHEANFQASAAFVELSSDVGDLMSFDLLATTSGIGYQQYGILNFVAGPGTTKLTVRAVMEDGTLAGLNPQSLLLDDFDLTGPAVPEPSSVILLLGGLAMAAAFRRGNRPRLSDRG